MNAYISLVYSIENSDKADYIKRTFFNAGLEVKSYDYLSSYNYLNDYESVYNNNPGGYVVILISKYDQTDSFVQKEINGYLRMNFKNRNTTIIPVYLDNIKPIINEPQMVSFKLYNNFEKQVDKLTNHIVNVNKINFDDMSPDIFERLVIDLLKKRRFRIIKMREKKDMGIDFIAKSRHKNPFGGSIYIEWLVECKYYKHRSPDLKQLRRLSAVIDFNSGNIRNAVMFTNGILTSASNDYLDSLKDNYNLKVVDGIQLKNLLLKYPKLIEKYFLERL